MGCQSRILPWGPRVWDSGSAARPVDGYFGEKGDFVGKLGFLGEKGDLRPPHSSAQGIFKAEKRQGPCKLPLISRAPGWNVQEWCHVDQGKGKSWRGMRMGGHLAALSTIDSTLGPRGPPT